MLHHTILGQRALLAVPCEGCAQHQSNGSVSVRTTIYNGGVYLLERAVVQVLQVLQDLYAFKRSVMRIHPSMAQQRQECFVPEINSFCVAAGTRSSGNASRGEVENMRETEGESGRGKTGRVILSLHLKGLI